MVYGGASKYQVRVASKIHATWQANQPLLADGRTRKHRWKTILSSDPADPSRQVDIANTAFHDLPEKWKLTNMNAARAIVSELLRHVKVKGGRRPKTLNVEFVEIASHFAHQQWITEHQHSCDTNALIPFYLLPLRKKNLLRKLVRMAIDLYDPEVDRLDNSVFPPRELVVVPLPDLEPDGEEPVQKAAWDEDEDEDAVAAVCDVALGVSVATFVFVRCVSGALEVGAPFADFVCVLLSNRDHTCAYGQARDARIAREQAEEEARKAAEARLKAAEDDEKRRKDPLHHYCLLYTSPSPRDRG